MKLTNKDDILVLLHDQDFDLEDIVFDKSLQTLKIKFRCELVQERKLLKKYFLVKEYSVPIAEAFLIIGNVLSYELIDEAQIGSGMLNEYSFLEDQGKMLIDATYVQLIVETTNPQIECEYTITGEQIIVRSIF